MSILLNALNKGRNEQDPDDIDELIANPLDETPESQAPAGINWVPILLGVIALVLIVICVLLYQLINAQNKPTQKVTPTEVLTSANNTTEQNNTSALNNASKVGNLSESTIPAGSDKTASNITRDEQANVAATLTNNEQKSQQFIELYKPQRYEKATNSSETAEPNQAASTERVYSTRSESRQSTSNTREYSSKINQSIPVREVDQLTDIERMMVNEVSVDAHIYSEDPTQRFIFVAGEMRSEGDKLINSWYLEAIELDGVVINNGVLRVRLKQ